MSPLDPMPIPFLFCALHRHSSLTLADSATGPAFQCAVCDAKTKRRRRLMRNLRRLALSMLIGVSAAYSPLAGGAVAAAIVGVEMAVWGVVRWRN